ncbi:MAG: SDR family NAD(P)-dependent oxidoreductase [Mycobacteriaceae bacterium]|nr:SDR family NAD(P)-dependent oxidoreductase [Mycobacteriaceae bacterium]
MTAALVTGASTGLGRELAGLFARDGIDVVVSSERSAAQLAELAGELRARHGVRVDPLTMDLAAPGPSSRGPPASGLVATGPLHHGRGDGGGGRLRGDAGRARRCDARTRVEGDAGGLGAFAVTKILPWCRATSCRGTEVRPP